MPLWGWVCIGLVAVFFGAGFVIMGLSALKTRKVMSAGVPVVAKIVVANDKLFKPLPAGSMIDYSFAQVVFTLTSDASDTHLQKLEAYAEQLRAFVPSANCGEDERIIGSVMRTHVPYARPLRLPDRLTNGEEVYTASVDVYWSMLPGGTLALPYLYCKVIVGPGGAIRMVEYPKA